MKTKIHCMKTSILPAISAFPAAAALAILALFSAAPDIQAADMRCASCGKRIGGNQNYLVSEDKTYCSDNCFEASLPKCAVCGRPLKSKGFKGADGRFFCSEKCLRTTWPVCTLCKKHVQNGKLVGGQSGKFFCDACADGPRCFCCNLPAKCRMLEDGRTVCPECDAQTITDDGAFKALAEEVRRKMKDELGISTDDRIAWRLVDMETLKKLSMNETAYMEMGVYKYETMEEKTILKKTSLLSGEVKTEVKDVVVQERHKIFILDKMPKWKIIEVAAHELAHNWMQKNYPNISDLKIREGWAEYVAAKVNAIYGNEARNLRIRENADETYGGGFRMMEAIAETDGYDGLIKLFAAENAK